MLQTLKKHSLLIEVPHRLDELSDFGPECEETEVGLQPGTVDALWERVQALFRTGVQPGMQLCIQHQGQTVFDRSIGYARGYDPAHGETTPCPLKTTTPTNLFSSGKAVTAMLVHKLEELGLLNIDDPVAKYIDGFARHGKGKITVRQVLAHQAGLANLAVGGDSGLDLDILQRRNAVRDVVINLKPAGKIGGAPAYHALSGGLILAEIMRAVSSCCPSELLNTHIKTPLGLNWLDYGVSAEELPNLALNAATGVLPPPLGWHMQRIVGGPFSQLVDLSNDDRFLQAVIPSANVISTARDAATLYTCLLQQGRHQDQQIFQARTIQKALKPAQSRAKLDRKIGLPMLYSAGFMLGHGGLSLYGWNQRNTFGHLGLSNTLTWARHDTQTAVALLCTGKPIIGPHLPELLSLFQGLNAFCENRLA